MKSQKSSTGRSPSESDPSDRAAADDAFLIVTGLSGSGKTAVSRFLEDFGYYCVDNLPVKLIPIFVDLWMRKEVEIEKVALIVDIREEGFDVKFPRVMKSIRPRLRPCVIFMDAEDSALIKRFSETRRPHPLKSKSSVRESIRLERKRLAHIKRMADEVIDTTDMSVVELRKHLGQRFSRKTSDSLKVMVISFGYKYGIPLDSDMVFDTRFLPNPFYIDELRRKTGKNRSVREFVLAAPETSAFIQELFRFVDFLMPRFVEEGKSYLTLAVGCTGGKHRSVTLADLLVEHLKSGRSDVQVNHRDLYR
jgi:UPF0042 nucleotide-binding protein